MKNFFKGNKCYGSNQPFELYDLYRFSPEKDQNIKQIGKYQSGAEEKN